MAVFIISMVFYVKTLSPTVAFWDAGEFIATSFILGIPHPPGTPLYVLVGRIFSLLPIAGSVALRVNLLSAFFSALAVAFVYLSVLMISRHWLHLGSDLLVHLGAVAGALVLAFSDSYWNNAVEAEVYGLSSCFMAVIFYLGLRWARNPEKGYRPLYLILYLLALSIGNHLASFLVGFGLLALVWFGDRRAGASLALTPLTLLPIWAIITSLGIKSAGTTTLVLFLILVAVVAVMRPPNWKFVFVGWLLFGLAVSVHLYLPIRSQLNPAIDEANPETWKALRAVLQRDQYAPLPIFQRKSPFGYQVLMFLDYFTAQIPLLALAAGLLGIAVNWLKDKRTLVALGLVFLASSLGLIIYLNFKLPPHKFLLDKFPPDTPVGMAAREVREREYFYTPAYFFFAYWIGIGAVYLLKEAPAVLATRLKLASHSWTRALLVIIVIAMPVASIATNYRKASREGDWIAHGYGENMLKSCEENAIIFTNGDNDTFPLWFLQEVEGVRKDVAVVNLSLLNTPWYWLQIKHGEHKVPLKLKDDEIERMTYGHILREEKLFLAGELELRLKAGQMLRVQDLGVFNIIKSNNWKRPIYFAVTVSTQNKVGLDKHLVMEGLVFRLHQKPQALTIDVDRTVDLLTNSYTYDGVFDPKVRKPRNTLRLLSNYAAAFSRAGRELLIRGDSQLGYDLFTTAARILPNDPGIRYYRAMALDAVGFADSALQEYLAIAESHPELLKLQAREYMKVNQLDKAMTLLQAYDSLHPGDEQVRWILEASKREGLRRAVPETTASASPDS